MRVAMAMCRYTRAVATDEGRGRCAACGHPADVHRAAGPCTLHYLWRRPCRCDIYVVGAPPFGVLHRVEAALVERAMNRRRAVVRFR
jgi:hypothetical protein